MHITWNWKVRCSMCFIICFTLFFYFMPFNFSQDTSFLSTFIPSRPCAHLWLISEKGLDLTFLLCVSVCWGGALFFFFFLSTPFSTQRLNPSICQHCAKMKMGPKSRYNSAATECGITFLKYFESNNSPPASEISRTRFLPVRFQWSLSYL